MDNCKNCSFDDYCFLNKDCWKREEELKENVSR